MACSCDARAEVAETVGLSDALDLREGHNPPMVVALAPRVALELQIYLAPSASAAGPAGVLILHPHPLLGGDMHNPMVQALFDACAHSGRFGAVLRANTRGVGGSKGPGGPSFWGGPEAHDCRLLIALLLRRLPPPRRPPSPGQPPLNPGLESVIPPSPRVTRVHVIGYSAGGCVAAQALGKGGIPQGVRSFVGLSVPLGFWAAAFVGRHGPALTCLAAGGLPVLMVTGDRDEFTGLADFRAALASMRTAAARNQGLESVESLVAPGVGHFWPGRWGEAAARIVTWVASIEDKIALEDEIKDRRP